MRGLQFMLMLCYTSWFMLSLAADEARKHGKEILSDSTDKGMAYCRKYKSYCKVMRPWQIRRYCSESCKVLLKEEPVDALTRRCRPYKPFCKQIQNGGAHKVWMTDNCYDYCKRLYKWIDGGYSNWNSWSSCSKKCGHGTQTRSRTCTQPAPKNGRDCHRLGQHSESRSCEGKSCAAFGLYGHNVFCAPDSKYGAKQMGFTSPTIESCHEACKHAKLFFRRKDNLCVCYFKSESDGTCKLTKMAKGLPPGDLYQVSG